MTDHELWCHAKECQNSPLCTVIGVPLCEDHANNLKDGDVVTLHDGSKLVAEIKQLKTMSKQVSQCNHFGNAKTAR